MRIEIEIPDSLPEGRRPSFKKGIIDALLEASTTATSHQHPPDGHEEYRRFGEKFGKELNAKIQEIYSK